METLTIDDVIVGLQKLKRNRGLTGNEPVTVASDYGDRNHTMQAVPLNEIETSTLEETDYSDSGYRVTGLEPLEGTHTVVVLNYDVF